MRTPIYISILTLFFLCSCTDDSSYDPDFNAGNSFANSQIRVIEIDTLTIETATIKFDSLITSNSNRILVGKYTDPEFGNVKTASFFEMLPNSYTIDSEATYDSINLYLHYDNYYYNDTISYNEIHIKRASEAIKPKEDAFYNTSKIEYDLEDIGMLTYSPRPMEADTLEIKINDDLGKEIFDKLQTKLITNTDEFKNYFRGITLQPGINDDGAVIGFSTETTSCYMRLYYSVEEDTYTSQSYIDIPINKGTDYVSFFNQISTENSNEYLQQLTNQEEGLSSNLSENKSFIQSGIGVATTVKFPTIKSLFDIEGTGTILDATLKINPVLQSYNDNLSLRDTLNVYAIDNNNNITQQLTYSDGSAVQAILNKTDQEFNNIYYALPFGTYVEELLNSQTDDIQAFALLPNNYQSSVDRMVIYGNTNTSYKIELNLIYTVYDED
ncbi:DUF4270 family protein [Galbibacter orientalis]|uniref:DUF4270 domain-containing protein n=1 Tax=Galbibacter orientalis DSM 19592 TaxID=926559 RepID=I3C8V1_9FLAO|nr:DUF4270 family protein [Galbibacter orientalis]EIJ40044.1 hypothetical protein JoomaDRAFT_3091 [Galbibacter orientalis DSM 19592]